MKKRLTLAVLLLLTSFTALAQVAEQVIDPITISYTELFDRIAAETDSVFRLSNVIVEYNEATDSLFSTLPFPNGLDRKPLRKETLIVDKAIELVNVRFTSDLKFLEEDMIRRKGGLYNIRFNKSVSITSLLNIEIFQCEFMGDLTLNNRYFIWASYIKDLKTKRIIGGISLQKSTVHGNVDISSNATSIPDKSFSNMRITENSFLLEPSEDGVASSIILGSSANSSFSVYNNVLKNKGQVLIYDYDNESTGIIGNDFNAANVRFDINNGKENRLDFDGNTFNGVISLRIDRLDPTYKLDFNQFNGRLISRTGLYEYYEANRSDTTGYTISKYDHAMDSLMVPYFEKGRVSLLSSFNEEIALRGMFFNHFKAKFNTKEANAIYVDMKDVETARLKYEYDTDPTFETFFSLQINRFLKTFSAYGTKPAKAVVFSAYVILLFALVYLFFPNHWDSHGKNRIMDRYRFFTKYMKKDSGMHEVYLDDKQPELMASEDFKGYMQQSEKEIPKFFMSTALPLYRWSIAGTKTFSWFLEKIDFLKGKWSETAPSKQSGKTFLLITAFLIALTYDIFIKMLNALMLSINTFTTLGFGEIPIKGLPRYLAIVQGFIGWFMLTIFSVSLISQLLN